MNAFQRLTRDMIGSSFSLVIRAIFLFKQRSKSEELKNKLKKMAPGTLGKDIADCLENNGLVPVRGFESHDLKHVLLAYEMTAEDEIRMQAFMLGNGNYTAPSLLIFIFGAIVLPDLWPTFYREFLKGRNSKPIKTWSIDNYKSFDTISLRNTVFNYSQPKQNLTTMKTLIKIGAKVSVISGFSGMAFCFPHLFSPVVADLVGAGFAFLAGAVLATGGLLTLSNLTITDKYAVVAESA